MMWKLRCLLHLVLCLGALEAITCKKGVPCFDNCIYTLGCFIESGKEPACSQPGFESCENVTAAGYKCCSGQEACDKVFAATKKIITKASTSTAAAATTTATTTVPRRPIKCRGGKPCNGVICAWAANNVKGGEYNPPYKSYCKREWTSCKDAKTKKCCDDRDYCDEKAFPPAPTATPSPKSAFAKATMLVVVTGLLALGI